MIKHQGIWLPDGEEHLVAWMNKSGGLVDGKGTYQYKKLLKALEYAKRFRTALDIGAHVGLWSRMIAKRFQTLHAFEPVAAHRDCWAKNMEGEGGTLHACALGETPGSIQMHTAPTSSGDSWVNGPGDIPLRRLDDFGLDDVDFIKIDCEGYELFVVRGGLETLRRCKPCIIIEQKPGHAKKFGLGQTEAIELLKAEGAVERICLAGDYILSWD